MCSRPFINEKWRRAIKNWIWNGEFESTRSRTSPSHTYNANMFSNGLEMIFFLFFLCPQLLQHAIKQTIDISSIECIHVFQLTYGQHWHWPDYNMIATERSRPEALFYSAAFFAYKSRSRPKPIWKRNVKTMQWNQLTLPKRCNILVWNDSSIFWVVRLRGMRAHIHRAPIDWDFGVIRPLRSTQSPNVWTVIWDFVESPLVPDSAVVVVCHHSMLDSHYPHVNSLLITLVVVCRHSMLDAFALDRVWPKRNC